MLAGKLFAAKLNLSGLNKTFICICALSGSGTNSMLKHCEKLQEKGVSNFCVTLKKC